MPPPAPPPLPAPPPPAPPTEPGALAWPLGAATAHGSDARPGGNAAAGDDADDPGHALLAGAAAHLPHAMAVVDRTQRLSWHNRALLALTDTSAAGLTGQPVPELLAQLGLPHEQLSAVRDALHSGLPAQATLRHHDPQGRLRWLALDLVPSRRGDGLVDGHLMLLIDLTEQLRQQAVLSHTVTAAGLGIWHWDMRNGDLKFNDRLLSMLGWRPGDIAPRIGAWSALLHPEDKAIWQQSLRSHLADPSEPCRAELRVRRPDGEWASVQCCGVVIAHDAQGKPSEMAGINIDLTEQTQMQAMLRHAARTDGLTQLPNRAAVFDHVQQVVERAARQPGFGYAVLFMDFDHFKQINDSLGHAAGDELLRQIAHRLRGALRSGDTVRQGARWQHTAGRIGGDEFVVVLEGVQSRDEAATVARRLMDVLAAPYDLNGHVVHSSASIGIVTAQNAANDAHTVMRDADTAMYEAKRAGRSRWVLFDPSMHERVAHQASLESDLRRALDQGELHVVYQPVLPLQPGAVLGVEALVRWRHPVRGMVPPSEFIPVAEESGLILPLGTFVLAEACRRFVALRRSLGAAAPATLAVNLSSRQLQSPQLVAQVRDCLASTGMAPEALQLEVTESLAAQDEQARAKLRELKALGLQLALDDFGTGYSSLACLHQLPVDTVKIDRSFVQHALASDYHRVLIEATIRVARTLGMDTVAEGIELAEQAELMRTLQCDRGQGFLFGRPMAEPELRAWLLQHAAAQPDGLLSADADQPQPRAA